MKSRCFKLYGAYSLSFNSSKLGNFFWSWILRLNWSSETRRKSLPCVHVLHKTWNKAFSRGSRAVTGEYTKKRDARAKLLFCQSKLIAFLPFSLTSQLSLFKLPYDKLRRPRCSCSFPLHYIDQFLPSKLPSFVYFCLWSSIKSTCQLRDPLANRTKAEARIGG